MTREEFMAVVEEVFSELLPKVKSVDRREFAATLASELQDQGLDIEDEDWEDEFQRELDEAEDE